MALKVKAQEKLQKIGTYAGKYRYVMMPEIYTSLSQEKVIKAWATEGHSVALPGLGTMRFGLRAKSVASAEEVKAGLISTRRIIFTPTVDLKDELASTAIQITCYDRTGKEVKRVTSTDPGTVEDPENENQNGNQNQNQGGGSQNQGGNQGGNTGGGGGDDDDVTYD